MARRYWLMKSEPTTYSWDDLRKEPGQTACWDGVRNYQARNFLRDEMRVGDGVLFYHSNADPKAVVGLAKVVHGGYPDPTQFDRRAKHYDPKSTHDNPRWYAVDIRADEELKRSVSLEQMRETPGLEVMRLLKKGNRLSVLPVTAGEWNLISKLGGL